MARKRDEDLDACGVVHGPGNDDESEVTITVRSSRGRSTALVEGVAGGHRFPDPLGGDAVRIQVRKGEVVITIRTDALDAGSSDPAVQAEPELAGSASRRGRMRAPAFLAAPAVGFVTVPADRIGQGYGNFTLRADLAESYAVAHAQVKALGGILTSSGAVRSLREPATPGRSKTSLHYTGRALDLFIYTGMQGATDPYMVTRSGGTDANPDWKLYCVSTAPLVNDPLYQQELIKEGELECAVWRKGVGYSTVKRRATYFCLTDLLAAHGWLPIPARKDWKVNYLSCEWWHFQHHEGLVPGRSLFGDELLQVWPADLVRASGLMLDAIWAGRSFRAPTRAIPARLPRSSSLRGYADPPIKRRPKKTADRTRPKSKGRPTRSRKKASGGLKSK